jgi:purine-nucleoside/S-methyl-5'-thioadenosine phosphorylase / adenosine deaminase
VPVDVVLRRRRRGALTVHEVGALDGLEVDAFVTGRDGGVSAAPFDSLNLGGHVGDDPACVEENRARVAAAAGVARDHLIVSHQVHGARAVLVDHGARDLSGDALVTEDPTIAICVLVADCVPVLLVGPEGARVAVAHAGWRGLDAGVLAAAVSFFEGPADLRVLLGPAISGSRYQVGPEVARRFADVPGALAPDEGERARLDLRVVAAHQLVELGVRDDHVFVTREVTGEGEFFSDRAQRPCGRFALVARSRSMRSP